MLATLKVKQATIPLPSVSKAISTASVLSQLGVPSYLPGTPDPQFYILTLMSTSVSPLVWWHSHYYSLIYSL